MLLIDDHQRQVAHRSEQRRARPNQDPLLARVHLPPLLTRLAQRQSRMTHRHLPGESRLEPGNRLRRQRNLRHQHDHPAARIQRPLRRLEIHLGLAAAGHPMQQKGVAAVRVEIIHDLLGRSPLLISQRRRLNRRRGRGWLRLVEAPDLPPVHQQINIRPSRAALSPRFGLVHRAGLQQPQQRDLSPLSRRPTQRIRRRPGILRTHGQLNDIVIQQRHRCRGQPIAQRPAPANRPSRLNLGHRAISKQRQQAGRSRPPSAWPCANDFAELLLADRQHQPLGPRLDLRDHGTEPRCRLPSSTRRPRRQEKRDAGGNRREIARREPVGEFQLTWRQQRLWIEHTINLARVVDFRLGRHFQHDPNRPLRPPGNHDRHPASQRQARRHGIRERTPLRAAVEHCDLRVAIGHLNRIQVLASNRSMTLAE